MVQIAAGISPFVSAEFPGSGTVQVISKDLAAIAQIIQQAEVMGQALGQAGPAKLTAAAPLVAQIVLQSSLLANHSIADQTKFTGGVNALASGVADILSSLHPDVQTVNKA
jgi:hypothetical protein